MEIVFFTTGCFLLTVLQQLHRFLNSYRTWELLTHKKMWNRELEVAKLRLQYSRSRPTVQFGHFGRCWKVVGFFSMHPRKVRHRCFGIGRAPKIFIFIKAIIMTVLLLSRMMNVNILWENYLVFFSHFICKPNVSTAAVFLFWKFFGLFWKNLGIFWIFSSAHSTNSFYFWKNEPNFWYCKIEKKTEKLKTKLHNE
jgi:hypothetical protein